MPLFNSSREKRFWLYATIVLLGIISTLVFGRPIVNIQLNEDIATGIFWLAFILIGTAVLIHGLNIKPKKTEIVIWLGITAVYLLLFLRLGHPERTHLMEYSVLAVFIHKALIERANLESHAFKTAALAFTLSLLIGTLDECVQLFLPSRVFDPIDILFNGLAAFLAISASTTLQWTKKRFTKNK